DLQIQSETLAAVRQMASEVTVVSAERIGMELDRLLRHKNRSKGVEQLAKTGLLKAIFPELADAVEQTDQWQGRLEVLARLQSPSLPTALAALLSGQTSPKKAKALCRRIRLTNVQGEQTAWLLEKLPHIEQAEELPWPQLQRILVAEGSGELMELATATWGGKQPGVVRCRELLSQPPEVLDPPTLATGDDLIAHGIAPGKHFKALLDYLRDEQLEGRLNSKDDALAAAKQWIARE
ncbi:MAG: hypothetical protein RID07_09930, partial [Lacipirellulaceae bacterium]